MYIGILFENVSKKNYRDIIKNQGSSKTKTNKEKVSKNGEEEGQQKNDRIHNKKKGLLTTLHICMYSYKYIDW